MSSLILISIVSPYFIFLIKIPLSERQVQDGEIGGFWDNSILRDNWGTTEQRLQNKKRNFIEKVRKLWELFRSWGNIPGMKKKKQWPWLFTFPLLSDRDGSSIQVLWLTLRVSVVYAKPALLELDSAGKEWCYIAHVHTPHTEIDPVGVTGPYCTHPHTQKKLPFPETVWN